MEKFKNSILGSVIILSAICFVMVLSLSFVNIVTAPIIEANSSSLTLEERLLLLPGADGFEKVEVDEVAEEIISIEKAENGAGFLFEVVVTGYHGEMKSMIAIDSEGNYTGINVFEHEETFGVGTKALDEARLSEYYDQPDPRLVDAIAGVTITSDALENSLIIAMDAFERIGG